MQQIEFQTSDLLRWQAEINSIGIVTMRLWSNFQGQWVAVSFGDWYRFISTTPNQTLSQESLDILAQTPVYTAYIKQVEQFFQAQ